MTLKLSLLLTGWNPFLVALYRWNTRKKAGFSTAVSESCLSWRWICTRMNKWSSHPSLKPIQYKQSPKITKVHPLGENNKPSILSYLVFSKLYVWNRKSVRITSLENWYRPDNQRILIKMKDFNSPLSTYTRTPSISESGHFLWCATTEIYIYILKL